MSFTKKIAAVVAGLSLAVAPVAASAAPAPSAAKLSLTRAGTASNHPTRFAGIPGTTLINIGILAALVVIVLVATNGGGSDNGSSPNSP